MTSISARNRQPRPSRPRLPARIKFDSGGRKPLPWKWAVPRLRRAHTYWIVTVRPDGRPHAVPIWGVWIDDSFVFITDADSVKVRNLEADPRCEICLEEDGEALTVEGQGIPLKSAEAIRKMARAYKAKYNWTVDPKAGLFYQVVPSRVLAYVENGSP